MWAVGFKRFDMPKYNKRLFRDGMVGPIGKNNCPFALLQMRKYTIFQ